MINEKIKSKYEKMAKHYDQSIDSLRESVGHLNEMGILTIADIEGKSQKIDNLLVPFQDDKFTDLPESRKKQFIDLYNMLIDTTTCFQASYDLAYTLRGLIITYNEYVSRCKIDEVLHGDEISIDEIKIFFDEATTIIDKAMVQWEQMRGDL